MLASKKSKSITTSTFLKKRKFSELINMSECSASVNKESSSTCSDSPNRETEEGVSLCDHLAGYVSKPDKTVEKNLKKLKTAAWKVRENAYCPYSGFKVGAALRSAKTGKIYVGCNVENAAYPTGICAERSAVCTAVSAEGPGVKFDEVVIVVNNDEPAAPCGPCRQMMVEFGNDAMINSYNHKSEKTRLTLEQLLPNSFGPHSFKPKAWKK